MRRATDTEHMERASAEGRAILTFDVGDFSRLAGRWTETGRHHAGVILSIETQHLGYGVVLRRLLALLDAWSAEELVDQVLWLDATP